MAIIQAPGGGWELLVDTLLNKERLAQSKEDLKLREKDFLLRQQQAQAEAQQRQQQAQEQEVRRQGAIAQLMPVVQSARQGDASAQQMLNQLGMGGIMFGNPATPQTQARMLAVTDRPAPTEPSQVEALRAQTRATRSTEALLGNFPENLRPAISQIMELRAAGLPAEMVNELGGRLLPETERQRLDRLVDQNALDEGRIKLRAALRAEGAAEFYTREIFPELATAGITLPDAVVTEITKTLASERVTNSRQMLLELTESIAGKTAIDPMTMQPTFVVTIEEALARAEDIITRLYPGTAPVLTGIERQELGVVAEAMAAINTNALKARGARLSEQELQVQIMAAAHELYPNLSDEQILRFIARARAKSAIF